jgi:Na+/proline symporter
MDLVESGTCALTELKMAIANTRQNPAFIALKLPILLVDGAIPLLLTWFYRPRPLQFDSESDCQMTQWPLAPTVHKGFPAPCSKPWVFCLIYRFMNASQLLGIILAYFFLLMLISRFTSRHSRDTTYFDGNRESIWFLVAFGMIGSGISAVSLVSIPGNVGNNKLYYFQFILGTIAGYLFIALVLIPIFFRLHLVSIYTYLKIRFGTVTYKTGSLFFLVSQSFGAALRLLLSIKILQVAFFDALHIPHTLTILVVLVLIWLYTHKSGVKTIVWTDALQSFFLITTILVSIYIIKRSLGLTTQSMVHTVLHHPYARIFDWDMHSGSNFFKQFISGMLITIALVGLDQSMMQKTLTVKNAHDAKKNVLAFSFFIALAQTMFLGLGILIYIYAERNAIRLPTQDGKFIQTDSLYPLLTLHYFGRVGAVAFLVGVIASTFASIDSCITALTTAFSYDFMDMANQPHHARNRIKNRVLIGVNLVLFLIIMMFWQSQGAIINTIFTIAGYTYGPILGLYIAGCLGAALATFGLNAFFLNAFQFDFGFMNILVNALLTILFLFVIKERSAVHG